MSADKPVGRIYVDMSLLREMLLLPEGYEIVGVTPPPIAVDYGLRPDMMALHVTGPKVTKDGQHIKLAYELPIQSWQSGSRGPIRLAEIQ